MLSCIWTERYLTGWMKSATSEFILWFGIVDPCSIWFQMQKKLGYICVHFSSKLVQGFESSSSSKVFRTMLPKFEISLMNRKKQKLAARIFLIKDLTWYHILLKRLNLHTWKTYIMVSMVYRILNNDVLFFRTFCVQELFCCYKKLQFQLVPYRSNNILHVPLLYIQSLRGTLPRCVTSSSNLNSFMHNFYM